MGAKIVRDRVEVWAQENGVSGQWRPCPDPIPALRKKLLEEIGEHIEHNDPGELYDLRDALDRLISLVDPAGTAAAEHELKVVRLGVFDDLIEWTPVPAENESKVQ